MTQAMSRETYRLWAETQPRRYELVDGAPIAMSPERYIQAAIKSAVWLALRSAIAQSGLSQCVALPDGMTVEIDDATDYQPDAAVHCGARIPNDAVAIPNPVVVVEVLSPSSQATDVGDKLADYFRASSIRHYLIL